MNQDTIPGDSLTSPDKAGLNRVRDQERSRSVREVDARVRSRKTQEGGGACTTSRGAECTYSLEPASRRWEQELCVTRGHELITEVLVARKHSYRARALSTSGRRTRRWTPEPVRYRRGSVPPRRRAADLARSAATPALRQRSMGLVVLILNLSDGNGAGLPHPRG